MTLRFCMLLAGGLLLLVAGCGPASHPALGKWSGEDNFGQTLSLEFQADGTVIWRIEGDQPFTKRGTYTVDFSQSPAHVDLIFDDRHLKTILAVEGDTLTIENVGSSKERPPEFGEDQLDMSRQQPLRGSTRFYLGASCRGIISTTSSRWANNAGVPPVWTNTMVSSAV